MLQLAAQEAATARRRRRRRRYGQRPDPATVSAPAPAPAAATAMAPVSALAAYVLTLHLSKFATATRRGDVCQHTSPVEQRRQWRRRRQWRPLAMAFERVNSICGGDADVTLLRLPLPPPLSSSGSDTYKTNVDGGVVHPWREQIAN